MVGGRPLRVLHLPFSAASVPSLTVQALRALGVDARGLILQGNPYNSTEGVEVCIPSGARRWGPSFVLGAAKASIKFLQLLRWADILHWYSGRWMWPGALDLALVRALGKPAIVQWMGSEVRSVDVECADNPVFAQRVAEGKIPLVYRLPHEASKARQKAFHKAGFAALLQPELVNHTDGSLGFRTYRTLLPVPLHRLSPVFPKASRSAPLVVHVPSNPAIKGTKEVEQAIRHAATTHRFRYETITGLPHDQAIAKLREADIVLDQFVLGAPGMLSLEAMALGKPVLCYLKPSVTAAYPADLPVVPAAPDDLVDELRRLLEDPALRQRIGRASRKYVERYHDSRIVAKHLLAIYQAELALRKTKGGP